MRLLQIRDNGEVSLVERPPDALPPYAILSHTWGTSNEEVTYQDLVNGIGEAKAGYRKIALCGRQAAQDGLQYFWVDTCCINKTSSAELSEAINSMYAWYQAAEVCYAYLVDVRSKDSLSTSKWFTRGWTLQELLAPQKVVFFDGRWNLLGTRIELREQVSECTRIPVSMLSQEKRLETFSVAQRMSWAAERKTSRIEDIAYCMMGIFDINMPLIYGEGENAFIRLQEEIMKISDDHSLFAWRSSDNRGGCLATSPASFRSSSNIIQSDSFDASYDPVIVGSNGVHLDVRFMGIGRGRLGCAILNCCEQGSGDERIAIYLRDTSLTMKRLERVNSEDFLQVDFETFAFSRYPIRRLCIQKTRIKSKWKVRVLGESSNALSVEQMDIGHPKSLVKAVQMGVEDNVWLLLTRQDIEVNEEDDNKQTALSYAAGNGKEEIVQMLISRTDVHINTRDVDGRTPMWWAAENGHIVVVKLLLETGKVDVNSTDKNGSTLLSRAVQVGDKEVIELLLGMGRVDVDLKDNDGRTPLSWASAVRESYSAATEQRMTVIKLLLETGKANANSRDKDGRTPLSWATAAAAAAAARERYSGEMEQRVVVIRLLLEEGNANANSRDKDGRTPLSWMAADESDSGEAARKLLVQEMVHNDTNSKDEDGWTPLVGAVLAGDIAVLKLLLETGKVNVNSKSRDGSTPLLKAVITGNKAIVKLLLGIVGIDVNIKDKDGRTPLSWAVTARVDRDNTIIRLLLKTAKVDVNLKDKEGRAPLLWAVSAVVGKSFVDDTAVMLLLKVAQIDVDPKDEDGRTPLSWAVEATVAAAAEGYAIFSRNEGVIYMLLGSGKVDVDSKDNKGRTPLSWAAGRAAALEVEAKHNRDGKLADYQRTAVVKLLLETRKVNVNSRDKDGRTPLSWAAAEGDKAKPICDLLVWEMVSSDIRSKDEDEDRLTLLPKAILAGDRAVVEVLLGTCRVNVNLKDMDGRTPLSRAVLVGNKAIIKLLLETGKVDINSKDEDGLTPLLGAVTAGDATLVKLLLGVCKIDVNLSDKDGLTPLSRAVLAGNKAVTELLLDTGKANIDLKDKNGQTPLTRAVLAGNEAIIELLKRSKIDVNTNNKDERKLLAKAAALVWGRTAGSRT